MKNNTWIKGWFEKCEELEIKPWEWDFKQSYIIEHCMLEYGFNF
ncbi:hypothetical protein [Bacillus australimaris]|nr:hypothetical protein [Bacillus australimaris]